MDNTEYSILMQRIIFNAFFLTACACMRDQVIVDHKIVADIVGHQPTIETMEDYYALQKEKELTQKTTQRKIDKEKLRHYLMPNIQ